MTAKVASFVHDVAVAAMAFLFAYFLRFNLDTPPNIGAVLVYTAVYAGFAAAAFLIFGVERGVWRFASMTDLRNIVMASTTAVLAFLLGMFLFNRLNLVPRSVPVIAWFVMIVFLSAPRFIYRMMMARPSGQVTGSRIKLLIAGTPAEADTLIRQFRLETSGEYHVVGVISYAGNLAGRRVRSVDVLGGVSDLKTILEQLDSAKLRPDALVIARPREHPSEAARTSEVGIAHGVRVTRMAEGVSPLGGSRPKLNPLTLDDLLGRAPVRLDANRMRALIERRSVLITGAGGSIGSEITRQVAGYGPNKLVIVDSSEYALYTIDHELQQAHPLLPRRSVIASVRDRDAMFRLIGETRPDIIFHAAALKHVPLIEANPCEGILTNVIGTQNVADAAATHGARAMVMISTDKAIRPSSVMGASKRAAEGYCQALELSGTGTRFITVRFGNVLGSNGSVVPLFQKQIEAGGPVTVTHPEMKRYFMSIREATELVLHAAAHGLADPRERGNIFVLDMGEPVKIVDLARTMISMSGRVPDVDIQVAFTGIRSGEKLFEELLDPDEANQPAGADGLIVVTPRRATLATLATRFEVLQQMAAEGDAAGALRVLSEIVVEYRPYSGATGELTTTPVPENSVPAG